MNIPENFDRWMFDYKEGNLSGLEKQAFEDFLVKHPEFELDADAWNNAFIENESHAYPQSNQLKKDNKVIGFWLAWSTASAAAIALLIGGFNFFKSDSKIENGVLKLANSNEGIQRESSRYLGLENETVQFDQYSAVNEESSVSDLIMLDAPISTNSDDLPQTDLNDQSAVQREQFDNIVYEEGVLEQTVLNENALHQTIGKIEQGDFTATYGDNPALNKLSFDVAKNESYDFNSWQNKMKRFWSKVEDAFDVPPTNLTNLRDPDILIPNSSVISFNPGFAGGMTTGRFEMNYRNQWLGSDFNSQQMTVSFDKYVRKIKGGIGMVANVKDYGMGQFSDYNLSLIYSPKVMLGRNLVFEPALKLTMGVLNGNGNTLPAEAQFELERGRVLNTPAEPQMLGNQQLWYKDLGAGFMLNSNKFYLGFSVDNINRHFENVYNLEGYATPTYSPLLINAIAGLDFENDPINGKKTISASPFLAYQNFGARQELWGGVNLRFGMFTLGGSISQNIDYTASLGLKFEKFKLIYQYDRTYSTLANSQIASHNVGVRFNGSRNKSRMNGPR